MNEHDITKKMMSVIRGGYKSLLPLNENDDTLSPNSNDAIYKDELKKLQDIIDPRVEITNFKIYPSDSNVIIDGIFLKGENEDTGIKFRMSLASNEIETSMNNIELSDRVSLLLQKLKGYYENWVDEWALKLSNEYKAKN